MSEMDRDLMERYASELLGMVSENATIFYSAIEIYGWGENPDGFEIVIGLSNLTEEQKMMALEKAKN